MPLAPLRRGRKKPLPKKVLPALDRESDCCVCYECIRQPLKKCRHWIHPTCVAKSGTSKCPLCRQHVTFSKADYSLMATVQRRTRVQREREQEAFLIELLTEEADDGQ